MVHVSWAVIVAVALRCLLACCHSVASDVQVAYQCPSAATMASAEQASRQVAAAPLQDQAAAAFALLGTHS